MSDNPHEVAEQESRRYKDAHGKWIGPPFLFCTVCRGLHDKCIMCRKVQDVRNLFPDLVDHSKYVRKTWEKLKKFRMLTTGCDELDRECRRMFGPWLILSTAELLSQVCLYFCEQYSVRLVDIVAIVERRQVEVQTSRRTNTLNRTLACIAVEEEFQEMHY